MQDTSRQISELTDFAAANGWKVLDTFTEKISGAKRNGERPELIRMMDFVSKHQIDKVLVWELSRLGRNTIEVLRTIETLNQAHVSLYIKNYNIDTLDESGNPNVMAQFLVTLLAEVAAMERSTIKERMDSGYRKFIKDGGKVGRKIGYRKNEEKLKNEYFNVIKLLKKGISIRNVAKLTNHSVNTVSKCKKIFSL